MPAKISPGPMLDSPDPLPGLLQRRADLEHALNHTLLGGGDSSGARGALAATDAAIVAAKANRARVEADARRAQEQRIRAVADDLVAKAAAKTEAIVRPLRARPAADLLATRA